MVKDLGDWVWAWVYFPEQRDDDNNDNNKIKVLKTLQKLNQSYNFIQHCIKYIQ